MRSIEVVARVVIAVVVVLVALPAAVHVADAQSPGPSIVPGVQCPAGQAVYGGGATLTRSTPVMVPGPLATLSGSFKKPSFGDACDPPVKAGPFLLMGAGKLKGHIVGNPPVPNEWSLYNANSSLLVMYEPYYRGVYGRGVELLVLGGNVERNDLTGTAEWYMPGRITVLVGSPRGSGPLNGGCFDQGFQATVEITDIYAAAPLVAGDLTHFGDRVTVVGSPSVVQTPPGGLQRVGPDSTVGFEGLPEETPELDVPDFQKHLGARLSEFERQGLPMPSSFYVNPGRYLDGYRLGTREELWELIKDIGDPCEAAIQAKAFLDLHEGEWTDEKIQNVGADVARDFLAPDEWDALKYLAMGIAPPLAPVFGAVGAVLDWKGAVGHSLDEVKRQTGQGNRQTVYDAIAKSKGWTRAQLDARLADLKERSAGLEREIEPIKDGLNRDIDRLHDDLAKIGCWPATLRNEERCATAFGTYMDRRRDLERAALEAITPLLVQMAEIRTETKALDLYRAPLADNDCDRIKRPAIPVLKSACAAGTRLEQGSLRQVGPGSVLLDGATISALGTEFVAEKSEALSRVKAVEGTVRIVTGAGETVELEAGKQIEWLAGGEPAVTDWDVTTDDGGPVDGMPLREMVADETAQPFGEVRAEFDGGRIPEGWVWQDPGGDTTVETPEAGVLKLTVPDGNELWRATSTAPRLLHKVTGDFTLEGTLLQQGKGLHASISEFVVYAPDAFLGLLANQTERDRLSGQYRILGGGWLRMEGKERLAAVVRDWGAPAHWFDGPPLPDHPIRMRLTRRGDLWRTYWSGDEGRTWTLSGQTEMQAPETLWAGWVFKRVAADGLRDEPAVNTLSGVTLTSAPRGAFDEEPGWDTDAWAGSAEVADDTVRVALDGTLPSGQVAAYRSGPLTGDFDVAFSIEPGPWAPTGDAERWYMLAASTPDGKNMVYVRALQHSAQGIRWDSDVRIEGGWRDYAWMKMGEAADPPAAHLRLRRTGDQYEAFGWSEGEWLPLGKPRPGFAGTLHLELDAFGRNLASERPVTATLRLESIAERGDLAAKAWTPADPGLFQRTSLPDGLVLPGGLKAVAFRAPFALGTLFFDRDGSALVFSNERDKQKLVRVGSDGTASIGVAGDVVAGNNRKSGVALDGGGLLVGVDFWPDGGNRYRGLMEVTPGQEPRQWKTQADFGGLGDVIAAPGGGYYVCDFERDGVWFLPGESEPEQPLVTEGDPLPAPMDLAFDLAGKTLYALNQAGGSPFGGTAGIYRIANGRAEPVVTRDDGVNYGGIAWNSGGALPAGLYATDPAAGTVVRIEGNVAEPVISGLAKPADLGFQPGTGDLWVVCDADTLVWAGADAPPKPASKSAGGAGKLTPSAPTPFAKAGVGVK